MSDDNKKTEHEKAYGEGVREARESSAFDQVAHNLNPFGPSTTKEKSHEAGWKDYWEGKPNTRESRTKREPPKSEPRPPIKPLTKPARTSARERSSYSRSSPRETARSGGSLQTRFSGGGGGYQSSGGIVSVGLGFLFMIGGLMQLFAPRPGATHTAPWFWIGLGLCCWLFKLIRLTKR
jgi:hypothetical protein